MSNRILIMIIKGVKIEASDTENQLLMSRSDMMIVCGGVSCVCCSDKQAKRVLFLVGCRAKGVSSGTLLERLLCCKNNEKSPFYTSNISRMVHDLAMSKNFKLLIWITFQIPLVD